VVLSRRYVEELGGFEPRFFLYYEDTDLSWRGRLRGWSYRYEPASVVHHEHSATVGDRSALAHHLAARNRLFLLVRCAPAGLVLRQVLRALGDLVAALHRDVVLQALHLRRPAPRHAVAQARVIAGFVGLLPAALRARRALGVGRRARARVLEWAGAGPATLRS
jgi:GT2 family glycosyltransferase